MKKLQQSKDMRARLLIRPKSQAHNVYQIYLYDEITDEGKLDWENWTYVNSKTSADYFKEELEQIPDNATIELYVNSNGGYVDEGTAIYNQLSRHKAYKIGYVDGVAYSAASLVLMACDHIVMGLGTSMLIHNMWTVAAGNANYLRKVADDLDSLMQSNRQIYLQRMNITDEELQVLMAAEKYLTPEECLEYGLCDEITGKMLHQSESEDENKNDDPDDEKDGDPDNEKDDDSDNEKDDDSGESDDPDDNSDNKKGDNEEKVMQMMKQMMKQISSIQKQNRQMMKKGNPVPKNPEKNKCISFFDQF